MKNWKKIVIGTMMIAAVAAVVPVTAGAQVIGGIGGGSNLGQLFVLNRLFNGPFGNSGGFTSYGDLLLWNQLVNGGVGIGGVGNSILGNSNLGLFGLFGLNPFWGGSSVPTNMGTNMGTNTNTGSNSNTPTSTTNSTNTTTTTP